MGRTDDLVVEPLTAADIDGGVALSTEAGWNQVAADWALMVRLGRAYAVRGPDGALIATGLALPYRPSFGWVSMVLVHGPYRRRGLGTNVLGRAIDELGAAGLTPLLDATPAGRPLYETLGFVAVEPLTRWRRVGTAPVPVDACVGLDVAAIADLDRRAFGADRTAVLADLAGRPGAFSRATDGAFVLSRVGRTATQLGPLVACETATALSLLDQAVTAIPGALVIDVPDRQQALVDRLRSLGFAPERPFLRMARGPAPPAGDPALVGAIAGPELG